MDEAATDGKPPDDHVEKAADDEAEEEAGCLEKHGRQHGVSVQERLLSKTGYRSRIADEGGV
jgi:hypothetical protein